MEKTYQNIAKHVLFSFLSVCCSHDHGRSCMNILQISAKNMQRICKKSAKKICPRADQRNEKKAEKMLLPESFISAFSHRKNCFFFLRAGLLARMLFPLRLPDHLISDIRQAASPCLRQTQAKKTLCPSTAGAAGIGLHSYSSGGCCSFTLHSLLSDMHHTLKDVQYYKVSLQ